MCDVCTPITRHGHPIHDPASQLNLTVECIVAVVQQSAGGNRSFLGEIVAEAMREIMNKLINLPQNVDTGGATSWSSNLMSDIQMCQLTLIRDCHTLPSVHFTLVQNKAI